MADINEELLRALNGPAPQHKKYGEQAFEFTEGEQGKLFTGNHVMTDSGLWVPQKGTSDGAINTQLTGSNMEDGEYIPTINAAQQELETLVDSEVIEANGRTGVVFLNPNGASEVYLFVQIDVQPWSLSYRNQFGSVSPQNGFPELNRVGETHDRARPAISFPLGYNPAQGIPSPSTMNEAKDWGLPITSDEYFRLWNYSSEDATVTVSILRVWR